MDNIVWVATIAGIALGAVIIMAIILNQQKNNDALPVLTYEYDAQGRLTSIQPQSNNNYVKLVGA